MNHISEVIGQRPGLEVGISGEPPFARLACVFKWPRCAVSLYSPFRFFMSDCWRRGGATSACSLCTLAALPWNIIKRR